MGPSRSNEVPVALTSAFNTTSDRSGDGVFLLEALKEVGRRRVALLAIRVQLLRLLDLVSSGSMTLR